MSYAGLAEYRSPTRTCPGLTVSGPAETAVPSRENRPSALAQRVILEGVAPSNDGVDVASEERWTTDADLLAARQRFANLIPGFRLPVAYSVARLDDGRLTFGHVNDQTSEHKLPAVVLASLCGYTNRTGTFPLSTDDLSGVVVALAPAEAAAHWEHPNLWSWRKLLEHSGPESTFIAFYLTDFDDPVVDEHDAAFRSLLPAPGQNSSQ